MVTGKSFENLDIVLGEIIQMFMGITNNAKIQQIAKEIIALCYNVPIEQADIVELITSQGNFLSTDLSLPFLPEEYCTIVMGWEDCVAGIENLQCEFSVAIAIPPKLWQIKNEDKKEPLTRLRILKLQQKVLELLQLAKLKSIGDLEFLGSYRKTIKEVSGVEMLFITSVNE